jgi:hypothetical protein
MTYDLLELADVDPEVVVQTLASSDDREELEAVRDVLEAESLLTVGSLTLQRFAVRPSLGPGQQYGMHERGGDKADKHDLVPFAKFAGA